MRALLTITSVEATADEWESIAKALGEQRETRRAATIRRSVKRQQARWYRDGMAIPLRVSGGSIGKLRGYVNADEVG